MDGPLQSALLSLYVLIVVVLRLVSSYVLEPWIDLYAKDYAGFGVVMAFFFWIAFSSFVIVEAPSLAVALAQRRR